ncbi:MAG: 4-hydroxy-tetrahydrodipicolinate reductase [Deltaproteobacteria bacterium ADurb.BinA014]|jgi:4-hydroxy-tetrahydrodipicolinate reductase|nr:MAG: 4-hydroxy-tetrahydrodipicolinate reductase [Deltaproteobacteria bacterium ADurb.BinA014]
MKERNDNQKRIKIGFFGFGNTGRMVADEFFKDGLFDLEWVVRKTKKDNHKYATRLLGYEVDDALIYSVDEVSPSFFQNHPVDIIIDFSSAKAHYQYAAAADFGIKIISAISKYTQDDLDDLNKMAEKTAVLYSPNITLGINFLLVASQILQGIAPHADIEIVEEHFRGKKEESGTALKIADILCLDKSKHVNSIRVGGIVGKHEIIFGLPNQTIRLIHESINRAAFGQGAIFAAKWLVNASAGLYSMENIIVDMFKRNIPVY